MRIQSSEFSRPVLWALGLMALVSSLYAQPAPSAGPATIDPDSNALVLARKYLEGGDDAQTALMEALQLMGWGVRDVQGRVLLAPAAGTDTGLAMRDYELDELLKNPRDQPAIRVISMAQALAIPFEDADAEELAQDLVDSIRAGADSKQPQQRFWARFIIALGIVSPANYDLSLPSPATSIPPNPKALEKLQLDENFNPLTLMKAMTPIPLWSDTDPVLAPSPLPHRAATSSGKSENRDSKRLKELYAEVATLSKGMSSSDDAIRTAATEKYQRVSAEMAVLTERARSAAMEQMSAVMQQMSGSSPATASPANDDEDAPKPPPIAKRDLAEWRDQPLSFLQVALITRVLTADIRLAAASGRRPGHASARSKNFPPRLPLAMIGERLSAAAAPTFGEQFSGASGDIWANGWGTYTGKVLDHNLPDNKFSKGANIANTIMAWLKTIISVVQQKITIEVENAPLVRTKTRAAGSLRTAKATVVIDFPKSDVFKAIRAAGNIATIDLQVPDGGPVEGAKVVWRLPEGSYGTKYQTAKGGAEYHPEFAVVQFEEGSGNEGYVSTTDKDGVATIKIQGVPQRKALSPTVRAYPRRAVVAVEVTIKVGNITQDLNDAISVAMGGPVYGSLNLLADMVLRTSMFFQKGQAFEVTDWKEPAWEGDFTITVTGSGSKHEKGEKGGPDADYQWSMNRVMEGRLRTPEWEETDEDKKEYSNDGRHPLEVDGDSRYFKLDDSSSSKTRKSHNRYEAVGPMQIQPAGNNQLELYARSEPSGSASLIFNGGFATLELQPFFGAQCVVGRSEQSGSRSFSKAGPEFLSLLNGVNPDTFTLIAPNDGKSEYVEGSKTYDGTGSLPYVPSFDVTVTVKYRLWKTGRPPKAAPR